MFFFYGWGTKSKEYDYFVNTPCDNCKGFQPKQVVGTYSYISLFFIPIIRWNKQYYLACNECGSIKEISKEEFQQIKQISVPGQVLNLAVVNNEIPQPTQATADFVDTKTQSEQPTASEQPPAEDIYQ